MKRVYIAGPMSNLPELNFPAFEAEASRLRALGYDVVSPHEVCPDKGMAWADCMKADIAALVTCDGIALLPGWERSKGASLEAHIACALNMRMVYPGEALAAIGVTA